MIKAVIFDWGGVIAPNDGGGWVHALAKLLNLSFEDALSLWRIAYVGLNMAAINENAFWERIEESSGISLPSDKGKIWQEGLASTPWPEMVHYVKSLQGKDIKAAILSNTIEPMERIPGFMQMYDGFDPVVLSHHFGIAKPNVEIYQEMLRLLNCNANECVFIDDMQINLNTAQQLGMQTVLAQNNPEKVILRTSKIIDTSS